MNVGTRYMFERTLPLSDAGLPDAQFFLAKLLTKNRPKVAKTFFLHKVN